MIRSTARRLFAALILLCLAWTVGATALGAGGLLSYFTLEVLPLGCTRAFASYPPDYDCANAGLLGVFAAWGLVASWLTMAVYCVASWRVATRRPAEHDRDGSETED
ncbi:hypothetical protein LP52_18970 [Streptomonospora alba]|uniref:Uncharacterized protein n=1 Tax=Streptomonospora alba TaxID=183763 RepID=A0A0C2J7R3_9ACTN|nr:hypothetical protein [Streptomonospora alba]KIH97506.1 hypothetical protein LP52_18970 [Streptomonospora alba]